MAKISEFGSKIKLKLKKKIVNGKIKRLKLKPERLDVKFEHKNKQKIKRLINKYNKELAPAYKATLDARTVAQAKFERELRKFDLKQYWNIRQANHVYAKSLFSGEKVEEAKQNHCASLEQLEKNRREKIVKLSEVCERYVSEHNNGDCNLEAKIAEYEKILSEKQEEVNSTVEKLREERITKLAQTRNATSEKIAQLNKSIDASQNLSLDDGVVLDVKNLCMYFGGLHAVEDLSFQVKEGEIFGLIGPNGAGKTTVFNCITQFYKCTSGEITFLNNEGTAVNLKELVVHDVILEGIARTFQNVEVIKEISVLDNLLVAVTRKYSANLFEQALNLPILNIEEKRLKEKALKILEILDLLAYKDWLAWGLPYGILKKVEIARALMTNPKLLILDEPAAGLNNTETAQLSKIILEIREKFNCSILLVEHDMGLVMSICDRICAISFGKMLAIGTASEIQSNKAVQEAYLGTEEV